jgi:SAM-dependent methyltransferase
MLREWLQHPLERAKKFVQSTRNFVRSLPSRGQGRWCPVCEKAARKFHTFGVVPRTDAACPFCRALERHRLVWLYFGKRTDLFRQTPGKMLHVAPEQCFEDRLRSRLGRNYVTADLADPRAMVKMDITDIPYPDESFEVIYCSHVLEHVPDDQKAMKEFYRVLKPGGWAILLVPITADKTFEDPAIVDPESIRTERSRPTLRS